MNRPKHTEQCTDTHEEHGGCLSCGQRRNMGSRKYCSVECRQKLRQQLNVRTGLLKALNTRYATFYFTDQLLVLDVLPLYSQIIFSFLFKRSSDRKPVQDFSDLCNLLGNAWWGEMKRTNREYLASRLVLEKATRQQAANQSVQPEVVRIPVIKGSNKALLHLKLDRTALASPELKRVIKSAYRRQARATHPDLGGDDANFRKIYAAYQSLMAWAEEPSFLKRSGFPDKWFYDGAKNRWVQPTPR